MISYAQAREDVMLHRALRHVPHSRGFYIDVGGYDPNYDSVTRHFYDHGWRGINVEPGERLFPSFVEHRPRDINLQVAVSDQPGVVTFHEIDNGQLCTLEEKFADRHVAAGMTKRSYTVPAMTLTQICEQHVTRNIHFLKIDVEGHEAAVLRGMDFARFRPWILVIEATEPNDLSAPTYDEWDSEVRAAGYEFVHTDVLNRYYVAKEHPSLIPHFAVPADNYCYAWLVRERDEARTRAANAEQRVGALEQALAEKMNSSLAS
jgi:FkbM family methyltransferase